ncbi:MAG: stalk domain-containing protein, partial [Agathobaculum sp.]|uniref:stalk domain-containing protein n=1 Tax=Agathobaculum sp. TaxID=2048138 RepID=UPI003D94E63E
MRRTHRFLACAAAAILTISTFAYAFEPVLDPLPDLSAYPTQLLVDGQSIKQGAMPQYINRTVLLPLRNVLEQAGYTVDWDAKNQNAVFSKNEAE